MKGAITTLEILQTVHTRRRRPRAARAAIPRTVVAVAGSGMGLERFSPVVSIYRLSK
jgi:hypothetical protein